MPTATGFDSARPAALSQPAQLPPPTPSSNGQMRAESPFENLVLVPPYQRFTTLSRPVASAEAARSAARFKPAGFKPLFLLSAVDTEYENIVLKTQVLSVL